jgi:hypothetical protein
MTRGGRVRDCSEKPTACVGAREGKRGLATESPAAGNAHVTKSTQNILNNQ